MEKKSKISYLSCNRGERYNAENDRAANYIGRRIAAARCQRGLSLSAFKTRLESFGVSVSPAAINKWEKGGSTPSAYQLIAVSKALELAEDMSYFMSSAEEELNEEGLRRLAEYRADLVASGHYRPEKECVIEYIDMPVSRLAASAGTGVFLDEENFEKVSFPAASVPRGARFGVRVSGDSMEPVYHDGQIVWVQPCESLKIGEVGIFICDGEGYLKVYGENMPDEEQWSELADSYGAVRPQPVLISYNKAYEARKISPDSDFRIVGKVL
ncbi:MAG: LexA family transcriptional regulator [Ruminococcaceae bacterium]|nr:LexA family transcriptional regulator [Oscillospiraceae bacterium]